MSEFGPKYARVVLRSPEEFRAFLSARQPPTWGKKLAIHHTWSPDQNQWRGISSLDGVFRYYRDVRGWPPGIGPHFFGGPDYPSKRWALFVATDPVYKGIGVAGRNSDSWHLEHAWNGDKQPFSEEVLDFSTWVLQELSRWAGLPIGWADAYSSASKGEFFHRDRKDANKSCPGNLVTHELVMRAYQRIQGDDDMPIEQFSAAVKAEMEEAQRALVAAGILGADTRPIDNVPTMGYVDLIAARIVEAIKSGKLVVGPGS